MQHFVTACDIVGLCNVEILRALSERMVVRCLCMEKELRFYLRQHGQVVPSILEDDPDHHLCPFSQTSETATVLGLASTQPISQYYRLSFHRDGNAERDRPRCASTPPSISVCTETMYTNNIRRSLLSSRRRIKSRYSNLLTLYPRTSLVTP